MLLSCNKSLESLKNEALAHMRLLLEENVVRRIEECDEPLQTKARRRRESHVGTEEHMMRQMNESEWERRREKQVTN
mgnify:CR=1 FL=1